MSAKCLLILSGKMIFIFYGFADGRINEIRHDGWFYASGRSPLSGAPGDCINWLPMYHS